MSEPLNFVDYDCIGLCRTSNATMIPTSISDKLAATRGRFSEMITSRLVVYPYYIESFGNQAFRKSSNRGNDLPIV